MKKMQQLSVINLTLTIIICKKLNLKGRHLSKFLKTTEFDVQM